MPTVEFPPGPSLPGFVQGIFLMLNSPLKGVRRMRTRHGDAFTVRLPVIGRIVVISDPAEVRQLFMSGPDLVENIEPNLGRALGPGSLFALTGQDHRKQRKLLVPPFHGRRLAAYEEIIEEEAVREMASWPQGGEFATQPSMMRITLNAILRAVFGAEGEEFDELRALMPPFVTYGSRLVALPLPRTDLGRWSPWGRFWMMRRRYDAIIDRLMDKAARQNLEERDDVLALMMQSRYDDGSSMSRSQIADQLLTLLAAGHETTATSLAWTVERLRRHPEVLRELTEEVDAGGSALRKATLVEVQRTRPVIEMTGRQVKADDFRLGRWTLPKGQTVLASIVLLHENESIFPNARAFDPSRFLAEKPDLYHWIPFGGGSRRCLGAAFAEMEMDVVLRVLLRDFTLVPTTEPGERYHWRGVANAPRKGGRAVVRRRDSQETPPAVAAVSGEQP